MITVPEPALAPVMPPVIAPTVQVNVLGTLAVSAMFGPVPLQVVAVFGVVTTGVGSTVTVMLYGVPGQDPVTDVGVTIYSTVPLAALPGLVSTCAMVLPDPALAPVMPPVMAPTVHVNVLGTEAVREIFGLVPLQVVAVPAVVTTGVGYTVTVILYGAPTQEPVTEVGVTI